MLVAGEGTNPLTQLLQAALPDFGFGQVTLLEQPTQQQLQDSLNNLMVRACLHHVAATSAAGTLGTTALPQPPVTRPHHL